MTDIDRAENEVALWTARIMHYYRSDYREQVVYDFLIAKLELANESLRLLKLEAA
jgi:hypothetical protein